MLVCIKSIFNHFRNNIKEVAVAAAELYQVVKKNESTENPKR